ncbi:MAG: hypothetical protein A3C07_00020 [Candidatus Sungbacteria bacterium RIFCSPHIGHO2_02_FULL_47_11]|uniref:DOD-type homing endonuclease domain-containing protein n=1 Tax=Candidatus Sungbacteria bacterium RIFCSPHIGHO2_02_FULL_47_11 TaxID=1802270 RepID=A0A1G2KGQ8_9BACT|nr:MAG: hypothetical protein A3C07_00020 [Candidatus Sungbacteria bacterium RIFCSPHIGHO2_02_FULL_47_11]
MPISRNLRRDFFKTWSGEMAYVLGFFAADGNMIKNQRGGHFIAFYNNDRTLLVNVRTVLGSNHKIGKRTYKISTRATGYQLQLGSKEMFADLIRLGLTPRKSKRMKLPAIPDELFRHFVRGYFDGDGCVYFKKHYIKARKKKRWIFSARFTAGSRMFLDSLHEQLHVHGLMKGFVISKSKNSGSDLVFSHRDSVALFHLMYDTMPDSGLYLVRKFKKFAKALQTLYT